MKELHKIDNALVSKRNETVNKAKREGKEKLEIKEALMTRHNLAFFLFLLKPPTFVLFYTVRFFPFIFLSSRKECENDCKRFH